MRTPAGKDVKELFLQTSFGYLVKHGLENTSVRDLCKVSNVSSGSVYYWFEDKDSLYIDIAEYGLKLVSGKLFEFAFENIHDLKQFLFIFVDEIQKYQPELRLIYQIATSPNYGERMRRQADELGIVYGKYINMLSKMLHKPVEDIAPLIYMFMAAVLDYVVWDDRKAVMMQMEYLYKLLMSKD